jgi:hypothetical protein
MSTSQPKNLSQPVSVLRPNEQMSVYGKVVNPDYAGKSNISVSTLHGSGSTSQSSSFLGGSVNSGLTSSILQTTKGVIDATTSILHGVTMGGSSIPTLISMDATNTAMKSASSMFPGLITQSQEDGQNTDWVEDITRGVQQIENEFPWIKGSTSNTTDQFVYGNDEFSNVSSDSPLLLSNQDNSGVKDVNLSDIIDKLNQYGDVDNFNLGVTPEGQLYVKDFSVSSQGSQYRQYGYVSASQYAYNSATGFVRGAVGRKATIWDYYMGAERMELSPQPFISPFTDYIYDYQGYQRIGTQAYSMQPLGNGYDLPYKYKERLKWLL